MLCFLRFRAIVPIIQTSFFLRIKQKIPVPNKWDRNLNSCGTTQIRTSCALNRVQSYTCRITAAPSHLTARAARIALRSPFTATVAAAISPSAALCKRLNHSYYSSSLVSRYGHIIAPETGFVKRKIQIFLFFANQSTVSYLSKPRIVPCSSSLALPPRISVLPPLTRGESAD